MERAESGEVFEHRCQRCKFSGQVRFINVWLTYLDKLKWTFQVQYSQYSTVKQSYACSNIITLVHMGEVGHRIKKVKNCLGYKNGV